MNGETLLIPGPVTMHEDVQVALARLASPHYGERWVELHRGLAARLAELFRTEDEVLLVFGPGTAALEMGMRSTLSPGDHVLVPITGSFGARLAELAQAADLVVHELTFPLGRPAEPELIEDELRRTPAIRAVAIVQHETMLGLVNPLREVCVLARERGLLTIVDAVSSLGGIKLEVDAWGIDICAAVGNKCLGGPVGIAPLAVSRRAWSAASDGRPKNAGWYLNLETWRRFAQEWGTWHPHPTTMPSAVVEALDVAVRRILLEGPDAYRARHAAAARRVRQSLREMGFEMLVPDEVASPVTTAVWAKPGMSVEDYVEWLRLKRRLRIAGATGELAGRVFRVAHMGRAAEAEVVDEAMESEALLLGRVTYLGFADAWPSRTGDFADKFNNMPKFVVSTTLEEAEWNNSTVIKGNVAEEVSRLKEQPGGDILVNGSRALMQTLMEHDLVDEYRLMVFPVVLGSGKRLFGEESGTTALRLAEAKPVGPDGIVILTYRPAAK